jgi:peptidoglycan hydrolase-like protein with peptidoglycan-binding domain
MTVDLEPSADPMDPAGGRRTRGRRRLTLVIVTVCAVATVAAVGAWGLGGKSGDADPVVLRTGGTVEVVRRTLTQAATLDATLDHGPETIVGLRATGTVTWLPGAGTTVRRGGELLRVDDRPVVLLYGSLPMYRRLAASAVTTPPAAEGTSTTAAPAPSPSSAPPPLTGRDVEQFESNLRDLGYTGFTVDEKFTAQTTQAVKRWQRDLGVPLTGAVEVGDVVYAPGKVRVARSLVRIGAAATGDLVSYTAFAKRVTVKAPAGDTAWAAPGAQVDVILPDGQVVPGKVTSVGTVASAAAQDGGDDSATDDQSSPTVPVLIDIADQASLGTLDSGPVTVRHVVEQHDDVLAVPVTALVALAEGGYGLELAGAGAGAGRFISVTTGLFADGMVEVSGVDVHEGMTARIPQ